MFSTSSITNEFEQEFKAYVNEQLSENTPLNEAMKYSLLSGGKRIRPQFALEASRLVPLPKKAALTFAFTIEIIHAFSLVHDDLPCMDNDDFRRGIPTTHKKFGENQALLAGDALANFAYQTFLSCLSEVSPESFKGAFQFFTDAVGGMILGQSEELQVDNSNLNELLRIQSLKTGLLFRASILCPLLLSGVKNSDPLYIDCNQYAEAFGFAFQIADDLEDETQDLNKNTKNILSHLGRASAIELATLKLRSSKLSSQFSATPQLLLKLK